LTQYESGGSAKPFGNLELTHEAMIENEHSGFDAPSEFSPIKSRWQENHGSLLMAFVGLIFLVGSGFLIYSQNRFVPPRFPESDMITPPDEALSEDGGVIGVEDVVFIRVTGAANDFGTIKIAIYESEQSFNNPDVAFATNALNINGGEAVWTVPVNRLPSSIAIAAYHDEDEDEQLSLNRFGIPRERYGFSRNARGLTGPPNFEQTVIDRPEGGQTLDVFIR
jgi:uncharacterized protein (DUF2141 family)